MLLLIADGELALSLLVGVCKRLKLLDWLGLGDFDAELDVAFGVFVAGLEKLSVDDGYGIWNDTDVDSSVVGKGAEGLVQSGIHLFSRALKETSTAFVC